MKRVRAAKVTGKPQTIEDIIKAGVVIVGSPKIENATGGPTRILALV